MASWRGVCGAAPRPPEFKRSAVELARQGDQPISQPARELGVAESGLHRWMPEADVDEGHRPGLTFDERKELAELRRKDRLLEVENEILKRAAAYVSVEDVLPQ